MPDKTLPELSRAEILAEAKRIKEGLMRTRMFGGYTLNDWRTSACSAEASLEDLLYRAQGIDPDTL